MWPTPTNDPTEFQAMRLAVNKGLIELAANELSIQPRRSEGKCVLLAFVCLTTPAGMEEIIANRVVAAGTVTQCMSIARTCKPDTEINVTMLERSLNTLIALSRTCRPILCRTSGLIDVLVTSLNLLHRKDDDALMMIGFKAARVLIRLVGKDDTSRVIRDNYVILDSYGDVLTKVLASGPQGGFQAYASSWRLAGLAMDLSLIALSDVNKPLLARFIHPVLDMVAQYGKDDVDLVHYGLVFLSQVMFDESCLAQLKQCKERVDNIKSLMHATKTANTETMLLLAVLVNAVFPAVPPPSQRPNSVLQRMANVVTRSPGRATNVKPQIMISYHQKSTGGHAQALVKMLESHGYRTWIDTRDMKGDVQEAMAMAVESSDLVMVLVSVGYKESANCRLECQYAFKRGTSVLFAVCEDSFDNPDSWLGLLMGQRMWVALFTPAMVDAKAGEVTRRVKETLEGGTASSSSSSQATTVSSPPASSLVEMRHMVKTQAVRLDKIEGENRALRAQLAAQSEMIVAQGARHQVELARLRADMMTGLGGGGGGTE